MKDNSYIYFLTNHYNNVLYVGVTNDLVRRIAEHKAKINKGFTYKYNCGKLVYYETFILMTDAIAREKQLKNWKREWKNKLISDINPEWRDLCEEIGIDEEYIEAIKAEYSRHAELVSASHEEIAGLLNLIQCRNDGAFQGIAGQTRNDGTELRNDGKNELLNFENEYVKK